MPVRPHTFVSPSADSRRAVVSYWRKCVHEVLGKRLEGISLPRKSVVRLTDPPDMAIDVYCGRQTTTQLQQLYRPIHSFTPWGRPDSPSSQLLFIYLLIYEKVFNPSPSPSEIPHETYTAEHSFNDTQDRFFT